VKRVFSSFMLGVLLLTISGGTHYASAQSQIETRYFPETGQSVSGRFLEYWTQNGGLMQQGYPISTLLEEQSPIDGKTYDVQYFERAVFELHPENQAPNDVLLSLLGVLANRQKYPDGAPGQIPNNDPGSVLFKETGKRVGGSFLVYFNEHGGVRQQGLPITDEFQEKSTLDGKTRTVQYFERAVFEWNPSNEPPYNVLLSQLGTFTYKAKQTPPPPKGPVLEPVVPAPADANKSQIGPVASSDYLIWSEGYPYGPRERGNFTDLDIYAIDVHTNKVITVTTASQDQTHATIDGSLVAWRNESAGCAECTPAGLYAKDLATGATYDIVRATADASQGYVAVAGRNVAWVEYAGNKNSIKVKNVDTSNTIVVKSLVGSSTGFTGLTGGGRYVVWDERDYGQQTSSGGLPYRIEAYDLVTGTEINVLTTTLNSSPDGNFPSYALDSNRLAVSVGPNKPFLVDLSANTKVELAYSAPMQIVALSGDRLLFSSSINFSDMFAMDLSSPELKTVQVLQTPPNTPSQEAPAYWAAVVGDWLVWSDGKGSQARLQHKKLD